MPSINGRAMARRDLMRRVGRLDQVAGVRLVTLGDGIERGELGETIEGVADAEARKAGAVIEDDGHAVERIMQVLAQAKVV